jgi:predicted RNA polymerase sigma factor
MALPYARSLGDRGPCVLQAELAAVHVTAGTWEETEWAALVALYDALAREAPSPVVRGERERPLQVRPANPCRRGADDREGLFRSSSRFYFFVG